MADSEAAEPPSITIDSLAAEMKTIKTLLYELTLDHRIGNQNEVPGVSNVGRTQPIGGRTDANGSRTPLEQPSSLFLGLEPATKSVLKPNPPFVFDGDRMRGQGFLHAVRTYVRLVPEGFTELGVPSEVKAVRYAMSYMGHDATQRWAERQCKREPFPFQTWDSFVAEFRLRFVEKNEQDHALQKLENRGYFMGHRDVYRYTDDFEDLYETAGFADPLVKVTKYRSGLDPNIDRAITTSGNPPGLLDYEEWRQRAYRQYEAILRARVSATGRESTKPALASNRPKTFPIQPVAFPKVPVTSAPLQKPAPPPPPPSLPIPMDVDRTRIRRSTRRGCFRCGSLSHFARDCPEPADVRGADLLDEIAEQLGPEMVEELVARVATARSIAEPVEPVQEGFLPCDE
jgi:hypothetical protein